MLFEPYVRFFKFGQGLYRRGQESLSNVQNSCMSVSYLLT